MALPLFVVDAFAEAPFRGNPAGVVLLEGPADPRWMQLVAREVNHAETAFVHPESSRGDGAWRLRWFTPTVEEELCGHATLAAAHVLWENGRLAPTATARFLTRSGELTARRIAGDVIELDFPAEVAREEAPPAALLPALRLAAPPRFVGRNRLDWLVELSEPGGEATLRALEPDFALLAALPRRGVIVTCAAAGPGPIDFLSRFFAPADGVPEDPVTGSAHCALAPHWAARLGRSTLTGYQASERGGTVGVELAGARVLLRGRAITTVKGELLA